MKIKILICLIGLVVIVVFLATITVVMAPVDQTYATEIIKINDQVINVEIAQTQNQQVLGLGERDSLADNSGMLFPYDNYGVRRFWMKGMRFPLDIIWIKDEVIVGIESNVPAPINLGDPLPIYTSPDNVNYVLEVNAGYCQENNINVGDTLAVELN